MLSLDELGENVINSSTKVCCLHFTRHIVPSVQLEGIAFGIISKQEFSDSYFHDTLKSVD